MKKYNFKKIDAFGTHNSEGNPAGMVYLDSFKDITADEMLRMASELKGFVSEVGYVCQKGKSTYELKFYSSEREVDFCGHATVAIMHDLIKNNPDLLNAEEITIITNKGSLAVENRIALEDAVFVSAPYPVFSAHEVPIDRIASALRIDMGGIDTRYPISVVNAGLETLIVPISTLEGMLSLSPELDELKDFCVQYNIDIITVYTDEVANLENKFRTRVFAATFGYLEDPATGSGNAALGCYLLKNNMWDGSLISVEQNGSYENPNILKLKTNEATGEDVQVLFGGGGIVRIVGEYLLQ